MNPESIRKLYDYNYWAFERVWNCVTHLSDDQFTQNIEYSAGSMRNHVVHMMSATRRWVARLQAVQLPPHLAFEDFTALTIAKAKWDELRSETLDYIHSLTQNQLEETVCWELPNWGIISENSR